MNALSVVGYIKDNRKDPMDFVEWLNQKEWNFREDMVSSSSLLYFIATHIQNTML